MRKTLEASNYFVWDICIVVIHLCVFFLNQEAIILTFIFSLENQKRTNKEKSDNKLKGKEKKRKYKMWCEKKQGTFDELVWFLVLTCRISHGDARLLRAPKRKRQYHTSLHPIFHHFFFWMLLAILEMYEMMENIGFW